MILGDKIDAFITVDEAKKHDFIIDIEEKKPIPCEFCGKERKALYLRDAIYNVLRRFSRHKRCDCEEAQKAYEIELELERQKRAEEERLQRQIEMQKKIERLFHQSKLTERFKTRIFDNFIVNNKNAKAFKVAKEYADNFQNYKNGMGIALMGNYGTGKTHLAAAITISLINKGIPVIFGTLTNLLSKIKSTYNSDSREDEESIINLYNTVDLLVIDDLGKEKISEWVLEKLFSIINQRYENYKPIIITTNFSADEIIERLTINSNFASAKAIVSRLCEICKWVIMDGDDYRMRSRG